MSNPTGDALRAGGYTDDGGVIRRLDDVAGTKAVLRMTRNGDQNVGKDGSAGPA